MGSEPLNFFDIQTQTNWGKALEYFAAWCQPQSGWLSLDIGTGAGLLPSLLTRAGCQAYGLELDFRSISPNRLHSELVQGTAYHLPFQAEIFHLVTSSNLLFLLDQPVQALVELRRVIRRGGMLALLNPSPIMSLPAAAALAAERNLEGLNRQSLLNWARQAEEHFRWNAAEMEAMLAVSGFKLEETSDRITSGLALLVRARAA